MTPKPADIRKAADFLRARRKQISPKDFAQAAADLNKSFVETLALISKLMAAGQGQGDFPETAEALRQEGTA